MGLWPTRPDLDVLFTAMHPPTFRMQHRLSDWPQRRIEVRCCGRQTDLPTRYLAERYGDRTFNEILSRLRCPKCGSRPAPVYLCAGPRERYGAHEADWAIQVG